MPAAITLPGVMFLLAYQSSARLRPGGGLEAGLPVILHMPGAGFLLLFAWLAGVGDILTAAAAALILGSRLPQGRQASRAGLARRNTPGLLDFTAAVCRGTALFSTCFGGPLSTAVMAALPPSLIPTFIVRSISSCI